MEAEIVINEDLVNGVREEAIGRKTQISLSGGAQILTSV